MVKSIKTQTSLVTLLLLFIIIAASRVLLPLVKIVDVSPVFPGDVFGYYLYLPAYFLHHDTGLNDFSWVRNAIAIYHLTPDFTQASIGPTGDYVMGFPPGMAILYAPFFFAGLLFASLCGYPADGFSYPFQVSMIAGSLISTFIGLWFLRKILLRFFNETITAITMILVVIGTNLFQIASFDGALPDNSLFAVFAMILWLTIRWHENPEWKYSISAGILAGLAILVKPSSAVILVVPVFWGIFDRASSKKKWDTVKVNRYQVIIFFTYAIMVAFFRLIYLKLHSGLFFYDAGSPADETRLLSPYLTQVLFSFKKGWLIYTPIMIFPLIGYYFLADKMKQVFHATFLFFIINLLLASSRTTWWDWESFGQRSLTGSYVILSLPMGFFISAVSQKKIWLKISVSLVAGFFILLNLFQTWQYQNGILHSSKMTAGYYRQIFGRLKAPPGSSCLLEGYRDNDMELLKREHYSLRRTLISYDFENTSTPYAYKIQDKFYRSAKHALRLDSTFRFSPGLNMKVKEVKDKNITGIRVSAWFHSGVPVRQNPCHIIVTLNHDGLNYRYRAKNLEETRIQERKWYELSMDYLVSERADTSDRLLVYIWYTGKHEIFIDDMKIEILQLSTR